MTDRISFFEEAIEWLSERWQSIEEIQSQSQSSLNIPAAIQEAIRNSIISTTKSYRYVLPTQLLAKLIDNTLDCHCVQESSNLSGSFDARSFCKQIIVPFDRDNHNVLGGSGDPYVNNPLRISAIVPEHRSAQRNISGFDDLRKVLDFAEDHSDLLTELYNHVLVAIRTRIDRVHIVYPIPNRISMEQMKSLLHTFLSERTGGVRLQAVSVALFQTIGKLFGLYHEVVSRSVNVSDASTRSAADLECVSETREVILAVEVKDRQLTLIDMQDKLNSIRERGIRELLYLVRGGVVEQDTDEVADLSRREFGAGQNLYVCEFVGFLESSLILFQEEGRRNMLQCIGQELDIHADLSHREAWRELLRST